MPKRAIYKDRYEKAINHIKYDTEIEELYFKEMEDQKCRSSRKRAMQLWRVILRLSRMAAKAPRAGLSLITYRPMRRRYVNGSATMQ